MPNTGTNSKWHFVDDNDLGSRQFYAEVLTVAPEDSQLLDEDPGCTVVVFNSDMGDEPDLAWHNDDHEAYKRLNLPLTAAQFTRKSGWHNCI